MSDLQARAIWLSREYNDFLEQYPGSRRHLETSFKKEITFSEKKVEDKSKLLPMIWKKKLSIISVFPQNYNDIFFWTIKNILKQIFQTISFAFVLRIEKCLERPIVFFLHVWCSKACLFLFFHVPLSVWKGNVCFKCLFLTK